jgi:hypothetical protein
MELAPPSGSFWGQVTRAEPPPPSSALPLLLLPELLPLPVLLPDPELLPLLVLLPDPELLLPELEVELGVPLLELVLLPLLLPEPLVLPASLPPPLFPLLQATAAGAPSDNNRRMPSLLIEEPPIGPIEVPSSKKRVSGAVAQKYFIVSHRLVSFGNS